MSDTPEIPSHMEYIKLTGSDGAGVIIGLKGMLEIIAEGAGNEDAQTVWWLQFLNAAAALATFHVGPENALAVLRSATEATTNLLDEFKASQTAH